jgi:hypothetical protein
MPATFPATNPESCGERPGETTGPGGADFDCCDAPDFVLLDASGPHPAALVLSTGCLSALLFFSVFLTRPPSATHSPQAETLREIVVPRGPLWLPASPPHPALRASPTRIPEHSQPAEPAREPQPSPVLMQGSRAAAEADPPALLPRSQLTVLPLPPGDFVSPALKLLPVAPGANHSAAGNLRNPAPELLGTLPLRRLMEHEAALAAGLAALPSDQRLALPQVSIRVNPEWLDALPQTQEKLYFSVTTPQVQTVVLAYLPATHTFALERPLRPLWQIRDVERVPALAALRSAAARRLSVPPALVALYTWHPPVFENALRMFVLARMEQMGVRLGPRDLVTVRLTSGPGGFVMNLEPVHGSR